MSFANDDMVRTIEPGFLAPADGKYSAGVAPASLSAGLAAAAANASSPRDIGATGAAESPVLGPNNERLEDVKPELVHALRELKTTSLTRERDDALRIARGCSILRRIGRATQWFLIGAAAGAVAAKAAH
jgi:hypothetical protein